MMIRWIAGAMLLALTPLPAMAQTPANPLAPDRIIDIAQPGVVVQVLQEEGYKAQLKKHDDGTPYIVSAANGSSFTVEFYGCKEGKDCGSLDFYAWYEKKPAYTLDFVNRWNDGNRFLVTSIDKDGDLATRMYVNLVGKTTYANFADTIDWWSSMTSSLFDAIEAEETKTVKPPAAKP